MSENIVIIDKRKRLQGESIKDPVDGLFFMDYVKLSKTVIF